MNWISRYLEKRREAKLLKDKCVKVAEVFILAGYNVDSEGGYCDWCYSRARDVREEFEIVSPAGEKFVRLKGVALSCLRCMIVLPSDGCTATRINTDSPDVISIAEFIGQNNKANSSLREAYIKAYEHLTQQLHHLREQMLLLPPSSNTAYRSLSE